MTPPLDLSPVLAKNLRALAKAHGSIAARLCLPVDTSHLVGEPLALRIHRSTFPLDLSPASVTDAMKDLPQGDCLVFGVGLGEVVDAALKAEPTRRVVAWDRDPALIRAALTQHDWSEPIVDGRLRIALGADLLDHMDLAVAQHPLLSQVYRWEADLLARKHTGPMVLMCAGGLFVDDVAAALVDRGYGVFTWDILTQSHPELERTMRRVDPAFVVVINHTHGLAEACAAHGKPLMVWEVDPATDALHKSKTPMDHVHVFTYREANVPLFRRAGYPHVTYMPLAANIERRVPMQQMPDGAQVCFVGASMVDQAQVFREQFLNAWVQHHRNHSSARAVGVEMLDSLLSAQRAAGRDYVVPKLMRERMGDFLAATPRLLTDDPVAMVGEMAAAERRLNVIARLGREGIEVWGDPGWKVTEASGAVHHGFAGHDQALTDIYQRGRIHVDVGRLYQLDIVPMRVFDILACGGFVIAEHSEALIQLFTVGKEIDTWRTVDELVEKVRYYKAHPGAARAIASRGLAAVRSRHTIGMRLDEMLGALPDQIHRSAG